MNAPRLFSRTGFTFLSTLVALSLGAAVAGVTVFVISRLVGAQRSVLDRDEVSEFSLFLKNVLNADATCANVLRHHAFKPEGEVDLSLPVGYGGVEGPIRGDADDQPGFSLPGGMVHVKALKLRDKGVAPVKFTIPTPDDHGVVQMVNVSRYLAQIRLEMVHANGDAYRARFVEVPVLINEHGEIEACNNQLSLGDACLALGFRLDASTQPPTCVPSNSCLVGGSFTYFTRNGAHVSCASPNPMTKTCACPEGFADSGLGLTGFSGSCGKFGCVYDYREVHQCYRCP